MSFAAVVLALAPLLGDAQEGVSLLQAAVASRAAKLASGAAAPAAASDFDADATALEGQLASLCASRGKRQAPREEAMPKLPEMPLEGLFVATIGAGLPPHQEPLTSVEPALPRESELGCALAEDEAQQLSSRGLAFEMLAVLLLVEGVRRYRRLCRDRAQALAAASLASKGSWEALMKAALSASETDFLMTESEEASPLLSQTDDWGCTLLHAAAQGGSIHIVRCLLDRGASVRNVDVWDETPLHMAAREGHVEVCELLLDSGADVNAPNAEDRTPLVVAAEAREQATCSLFLGRGGGVGQLPDDRVPPLLTRLLLADLVKDLKTL